MSKKSASYIEKMVGSEMKWKKKKKQKKTEAGAVKRLAKNGLIDNCKDEVGSASLIIMHQEEIFEEEEKEEERLILLFLL